MKTKNWMTKGLPDFYKELMGAWGKFLTNVHFKPLGRENILNQPLFLNDCILNQGKEVFLQNGGIWESQKSEMFYMNSKKGFYQCNTLWM